MSSPTILITGATGGLGSSVIRSLLDQNLVPASSIIASSRQESVRAYFTSLGVQFRAVDFDDEKSLETAFTGVDRLFFVSTNTFDVKKRIAQHKNVIVAAEHAGVGHVYYSSLAFGGYRSDSKIAVQQAHLITEKMMAESSLVYTSVRMGVYADAFPLFLDWFPTTKTIYIPSITTAARIAFTSRAELGEATARLMVRPSADFARKIVLLTGSEAVTLKELVDAINRTTGRDVRVQEVSIEEWVDKMVEEDQGEKGRAFFETRVSWIEGIAKGDGETVDPLMSELLGRPAKKGTEVVEKLLREDRDYTWHQNYSKNHR